MGEVWLGLNRIYEIYVSSFEKFVAIGGSVFCAVDKQPSLNLICNFTNLSCAFYNSVPYALVFYVHRFNVN